MVKTVGELKELIEWAKKTRVKSLNISVSGDVQVELSDYAFIENLTDDAPTAPVKDAATTTTPDWSSGDTAEDKAEEEAVLFHSSR